MLRQEKRRRQREIAKETKHIWTVSPLKRIMKSKPFNSLTIEEIEILDKGEFQDKKIQSDYNIVKTLMLRLRELRDQSVQLQSK